MSGAPQVAADPATASRRAQNSRGASALWIGLGRRDRGFVVAAVLTALWAVYQNFYKLGTAPILADEPTYTETAWRYVHGQVQPPGPSGGTLIGTPDNFEHPPLAKYLFGLAQLIVGTPNSLTAARAVSAFATVLAAAVVAVWIGRYAGRWTGLPAGALLALLPEPAGGSIGRFDRFAMLDPVASLFMVLSVVAAWEWARRTGRGAWFFAALTGVAVGCAAGSKENGFLGAVGPVLVVLVVAPIVAARSGVGGSPLRALGLRSIQACVTIAASLIVFVGLYLPLGHPIARIRYLIDFQSAQSSVGHMIGFAGRVSSSPPWWANLWFAGHGFGSVLAAFLVVAALCAVLLRRDALVGWCAAALLAPFVFHCFIANVALGYYWVMWTPMFLVLAALGAAEVIRRAASVPRLAVPVALVTGAAVLAVPVGESIDQSVIVADIQPTGVMVVPKLMREHGLKGPVVSAGLPSWYWSYYMPKTTVYSSVTQPNATQPNATSPLTGAETIVIGQPQCRTLIDQSVRALVDVNLRAGQVERIYTDSAITAYAVTGHLIMPTSAQINAEAPDKLTDHC